MNFEELKTMMQATEDFIAGRGASETEIQEAERQLGVTIRGDYRRFLAELGWCNVGHYEIFGIGSDVGPRVDLVGITISERTEMDARLPPELIPVMNNGGGDLYCVDLTSDGLHIVYWDHTLGEDQQPDIVAANFWEWLAEMVRELPPPGSD